MSNPISSLGSIRQWQGSTKWPRVERSYSSRQFSIHCTSTMRAWQIAHSFFCVSVRSSRLPWHSAISSARRLALNKGRKPRLCCRHYRPDCVTREDRFSAKCYIIEVKIPTYIAYWDDLAQRTKRDLLKQEAFWNKDGMLKTLLW